MFFSLLATYIKQNESELENDAKQGNDSDAERKNKAEQDSKTTEEEIPSCLCYNGTNHSKLAYNNKSNV